MKKNRISEFILCISAIFYLCLIVMCVMDYIQYNGYLWGVFTVIMTIAFVGALMPDVMVNIGYKICICDVRKSVIAKTASLVLFLGIWSYLEDEYKKLLVGICVIIFLYDSYLMLKIGKNIEKENIKFQTMIEQIKKIDMKTVDNLYSLLWKSIVAFVVYISLNSPNIVFSILFSCVLAIFQLYMIFMIRKEMKRIDELKNIRVNVISAFLVINTMLIILLSEFGIKKIFICILIGGHWAIISDNALLKKSSVFRFAKGKGEK